MASEPSEEEISNFISFTSTSREQAIRFLKVSYKAKEKEKKKKKKKKRNRKIPVPELTSSCYLIQTGKQFEFTKSNKRVFRGSYRISSTGDSSGMSLLNVLV